MFQSAQTLSLNDDHIIVIMVIFSLILAGMCFTFIYNCIKKLIRDHQTIQVKWGRYGLAFLKKQSRFVGGTHFARGALWCKICLEI
jgi:hypothetical protein